MKEYQEIRDTSPLGLKMLNDQLRLLWFRVKNTTTKDIRDNAITGEKIQAESIDGQHIKPKSITTGHIDADFAMIEDLQTVNARIDNLVVNTAMIEDLAVTNAKIANAAIDTSNIKLGAITTALIDTGAIETAQIADGSITDAKIVDLTANKINAGTLDVERLIIRSSTEPEKSLIYEINNITGALQSVQGNTLNGEILTNRSITTDKIVANAITANEIASKTITANEIAANAVTANEIAANAITAGKIKAGEIDTVHLKAGAVTTDKIASTVGGSLDLSSNTAIIARVTEEQMEEAIDNIQVGGRNLLLKSKVSKTSSTYNIGYFTSTRDFVPGETLTVTIKGNIPGSKLFGIWFNSGSLSAGSIPKVSDGLYSRTITVPSATTTRSVGIYLVGNQAGTDSWTVEWIKLEKGNKSTDWSPAPEELTEKDKLISEINLSPGTAKIQANKINLVGAVTVLSDIAGNLGTINAGTINGVTINASTFKASPTSSEYGLEIRRGLIEAKNNNAKTLFRLGGFRLTYPNSGNTYDGGSISAEEVLALRTNPAGAGARIYITKSSGIQVIGGKLNAESGIGNLVSGSILLDVNNWKSFTFQQLGKPVVFFSKPTVVLTSQDGINSISNGKVRNVTTTGFEAILGGSGYPDSTHGYIAYSYGGEVIN